jgi:hypothetical protein
MDRLDGTRGGQLFPWRRGVPTRPVSDGRRLGASSPSAVPLSDISCLPLIQPAVTPGRRGQIASPGAIGIGLAAALALLAGCTGAVKSGAHSSSERRPWRFTEFPIIAWWGPPGTAGREAFEAYRDAGFTLHATNPDEGFAEALAHVEAVGLQAMVFRTAQGFALPPLPNPGFPAHRDAIVGWIAEDEPAGAERVARAIGRVETLMETDPTRWAFFNMLSPHLAGIPATAAAIDAAAQRGMPILSYDTYVTMADGTDRADLLYDHLALFRRASLRHGVPFWAFALTIEHGPYRRPSESDLRWQQYSNLAYGAKGLWYFTYWAPVGWPGWDHRAIVDATDGSRTELYDWVRAINHAVRDMGPLLLRLTSTDVVHTHPPPRERGFEAGRSWITDIRARDALVGYFSDSAGTRYAMVVNKVHGPGRSARDTADSLELRFADSVRAVDIVSWLDGVPGPLALEDGRARLRVGGGTGVLLRATLR